LEGRDIWLYTDEGFLSIVDFDPAKDKQNRSNRERKRWGKNPKLVRGRIKEDFEQIRPYYSKLRVEEDKAADYLFRAVVPGERMADFIADKMRTIDYNSHFKETCIKRAPKADRRLHEIWTIIAKMQPHAPYSGVKNWLCASFIEKEINGKLTKVYCSKVSGHDKWDKASSETRAHKYDDTEKPKTTSAYPYSYGSYGAYGTASKPTDTSTPDTSKLLLNKKEGAKPYDPSDPFDMPDTPEEMVKALMNVTTDNIFVDSSTPVVTYDLWEKAYVEFESQKRVLTRGEVVDILESLSEDPLVTDEYREVYSDLAHELTAEGFANGDFSEDTNVDDVSIFSVEELVD